MAKIQLMKTLVWPVATYDCESWTLRKMKKHVLTPLRYKNSSGDEIANANSFTTISHTYFKIPKREPTSFNKLDDS